MAPTTSSPSAPRAHGEPKRARLGFFAGVRAVFGGAAFVVTTPSAWAWAAVPVLVATLLLAGLGAAAIWAGAELAHRIAPEPSAASSSAIGHWVLRVLLSLVGLVLAFVVSLSLAQPLSGFSLEALARKQELALGGRTWPALPFFAGLSRSLRVSLTALALGLPVLALLAVVTVLLPPVAVVTVPLKLVVTGLLAAYDFLDYPLSVRGHGVRMRLAFMRREAWAVLGFGTAIALLLLVPFAGLLVLPFGAAGAARLVVAGDRASLTADPLAIPGG